MKRRRPIEARCSTNQSPGRIAGLRALLALGPAVALLSAPAPAIADDKAVCAEAYHQSQVLRDQGKLVLARAQIMVCKAACPAHISGDCDEWMADVETKLGSLVIVARDAGGNAVVAPHVEIDGRSADAHQAIEIDPGAHVVRIEHGGTTIEKRVEVARGEKGKQLEVLFPGGEPAPPAARAALPPSPEPAPLPAPEADGAGPPVATWVLGIGGAALLGAAATLAIHGQVRRSDLESCSPRCDPDRLDSIRTEWFVAGGLAGAGALAVGAAAVVWASAPTATRGAQAAPTRALIVAPHTGGAAAWLRGTF